MRRRGNPTTRAQRDARRARAWAAAAEVVAALDLTRPEDLDVERMAMELDADVIDDELAGADAQLVVRDQQRRPLDLRARIRVARTASPSRRRFSIAHELGHFVMRHQPASISELCTAGAMDGRSPRPEEEEANAFAAALLLPERMVGPWAMNADANLDAARDIARAFAVAIDTAAIRLIELTTHAWALVTTRSGIVSRVSRSAAFRTFIDDGWTPGPDSAVVERVAWGRALAKQERAVPVETWIADTGLSGATLIEHSVILPGTSDVFTMLRLCRAT